MIRECSLEVFGANPRRISAAVREPAAPRQGSVAPDVVKQLTQVAHRPLPKSDAREHEAAMRHEVEEIVKRAVFRLTQLVEAWLPRGKVREI